MSTADEIRLEAGDLLPSMRTPPPGGRSREISRSLGRHEAPCVNTRYGGRDSVQWQEALGANVLDVDGNRYVDLTAGFGVAGVGHRHPRVVDAVREQAGRLLHGLGDVHGHPARAELARRLTGLAPMSDARVYFAVSGADAVEIALETAVLATGRFEVLAFESAYHGLTTGALAVSSRDEFRRPFRDVLRPGVHRLGRNCSANDLDRLFDRHPGIGAAIVEPVAGREGVLFPEEGWLETLGRICGERGIVTIADEIFTGLGRTGCLFAAPSWGLEPDLLCCGKALGGGLPIAAVLGRCPLLDAWDRGGEALHTATFLAHPLSTAASLATLDVLEQENLVERARLEGERIAPSIASLRRHEAVTDVRGRGLLWAIELESADLCRRIADGCLKAGFLLLTGGDGRSLQVCPPLVITREQLDCALDRIDKLLSRMEESR